ncbi:MAG: HAMP domain-containing sensor histidine kinase [Myxococcales bacterium]
MDPSGQRARSVVVLVVLTIAVPSLLLTGLAALAVSNEASATKSRLEYQYKPVLQKCAERFNGTMDELLKEAPELLQRLRQAAEADDDEGAPAFPDLAQSAAARYAVNPFVVTSEGEVLLPRPSDAPEGGLRVTLESASSPRFLEQAEALATLASPTNWAHPATLEQGARLAAAQLKTLPESPKVELVRRKLMYIAERPALLGHLSHLSHAKEGPPTIHAFYIDGYHRVVVAQPMDGMLVGYELVPSAFDALVTEATAQAGPPLPTDTLILPVLPPPFFSRLSKEEWMKVEEKVASYALLKKTDLAWEIVFMPNDKEASLLSLQGNRTRLILWSLLLVVAALIAGIAYTVRSIVKEARQNRLKVDFVSSVSHDLRTPLTSIRMFTETLLLGRVRNEQESKECLEVIAQETERLSRLTQRILDFSRMEAGRKAYSPKPEPIQDVVQQALLACKPVIEQAGFQVEVAIAPEATTVVADRDALIEVLINLVTNAIKYSPEDKRLRIGAKKANGVVVLSVEDHGIGIPKSEQAKIFEKFYRVDCRRTTEVGGCGIGLSLVDHIVKAHGGSVAVQSEPGRGSTFTVRLPDGAMQD